MYILRLGDTDTIVLILCIVTLSILFGWIADHILRESSAGTAWNSIFFAIGATAGLFGLDYVATYQYFPYYEPKSQAWILSGAVGGSVLLVITSSINMYFRRRSVGA